METVQITLLRRTPSSSPEFECAGCQFVTSKGMRAENFAPQNPLEVPANAVYNGRKTVVVVVFK